MKNFILDSNVIMHDPDCIFEFDDNKVIILFEVLEEFDKYKVSAQDVGDNVRKAIRTLDKLRAKGHLDKGVKLKNGGIVSVMSGKDHHAISNKYSDKDKILLSTAMTLAEHVDNPVILVTKNVNLRIKADAVGVSAVDYEKDKGNYDYAGHNIMDITKEQARIFEKEGYFFADPPPPIKNEYFRFTCEGKNLPLLGKHKADGEIERIYEQSTMKVSAKNIEQTFAINALMDDDIKFVTLQAKAGAGKTLLAICAALQKVKDKKYKKILIARPIISVGRDLGHLPGDIDEKMAPWMKPIMDNIGVITESGYTEHDLTKNIEISPITYIRGRSLGKSYIIIDEAQNLTPREIKTIATRVGEGSKIVFTGDVSQIDLPTLDAASSGFTYLINRFKDNHLHAHIQLSKSERSEAAEAAADLL